MKYSVLLITLIISPAIYSARICESYIPDEWPNARYSNENILGDHVVTDHRTGMMWKQCSEGLSGIACTTGSATTHTWQQALELVETQNKSGFGGYSDWRLPNAEEFGTLLAINCSNPSINETAFPNTIQNVFWSSSPVANSETNAWAAIFNYGFIGISNRENELLVRLVRSGR